ncbi:Cyclin-dependent kinase inhibitor family-containing protein [Strongyloides ratti]|uniref:Cyclin-dependent kinase inhibitor family-containing protein n=1 Tax=Strongyloides ratti TaxID=34506 RepID=A0A090L7T9_STRRB|nr:Cyclin-dependent kinase inhibitor family-containing protein [Strongyloides ratti]CEF65866.1 Cyclin-dependent kinase inhibitor family-containing protein [Strongyloides ratti]
MSATITMIISPSVTTLHQNSTLSIHNSPSFKTPRKSGVSRGINKKKSVCRRLTFNTTTSTTPIDTDIFLDNLLSDIYSKYNKKYNYDFVEDYPMENCIFKECPSTSEVPLFYKTKNNIRSLSPEVLENLCPTMTSSTKISKNTKGNGKQMRLTDYLLAKRKNSKNCDSMKLSRTPLKSRPFGVGNTTNITMTC